MDEIVFSGIEKYQDVELKAVNKTSASDDLKDESAPDKTEEMKPLIEKIRTALGDSVKDVRASWCGWRIARHACVLDEDGSHRLRCSRCCGRWGSEADAGY